MSGYECPKCNVEMGRCKHISPVRALQVILRVLHQTREGGKLSAVDKGDVLTIVECVASAGMETPLEDAGAFTENPIRKG